MHVPRVGLGDVVWSKWAREALVVAKQLAEWHFPGVQQKRMAVFVAKGHLVWHVRHAWVV
jgi:GntR family transcriptional regulator / MocR family aminotransferase